MIIKFKVLVDTQLEKYQNYDCDILAIFKYCDKTHYIAFIQESKYDSPKLMFLSEDEVVKIIDNEIPCDWVKSEKICSNCYYDGILHFSLDLYDLFCPEWMIQNSSFFANVIDNSFGYEQLFKFEPNRFKNRDDIEIWNR